MAHAVPPAHRHMPSGWVIVVLVLVALALAVVLMNALAQGFYEEF